MDTAELVEVFTTTHEAEAEVIRGLLEAEGIDSQISGANQGGFAGVLDVKVFVKASDELQARSILQEKQDDAEFADEAEFAAEAELAGEAEDYAEDEVD